MPRPARRPGGIGCGRTPRRASRTGSASSSSACSFIAGGLALAVLPGPLTIPPVLIGLWIWSSEFAFAQRFFDAFKEKADEAWEQPSAHPVSSAAIRRRPRRGGRCVLGDPALRADRRRQERALLAGRKACSTHVLSPFGRSEAHTCQTMIPLHLTSTTIHVTADQAERLIAAAVAEWLPGVRALLTKSGDDTEVLSALRRKTPTNHSYRGRTMSVARRSLTRLVVAVARGRRRLVALAALIPDLNPFGTETKDRSQPVLLKSLESLSEYRAASANLQVVVDVEQDASPAGLHQGPADAAGRGRERRRGRGLRRPEGREPQVVNEDRTAATITLPGATLSDARIDLERTRVFDTDRGLLDRVGDAFGSGGADEERRLLRLAQRKLAEAARADPNILRTAERNTTLDARGDAARPGLRARDDPLRPLEPELADRAARVDVRAADGDLEVQVRTGRRAGAADRADPRARDDALAARDGDRREVRVERPHAGAVGDDHVVPPPASTPRRPRDRARRRRRGCRSRAGKSRPACRRLPRKRYRSPTAALTGRISRIGSPATAGAARGASPARHAVGAQAGPALEAAQRAVGPPPEPAVDRPRREAGSREEELQPGHVPPAHPVPQRPRADPRAPAAAERAARRRARRPRRRPEPRRRWNRRTAARVPGPRRPSMSPE